MRLTMRNITWEKSNMSFSWKTEAKWDLQSAIDSEFEGKCQRSAGTVITKCVLQNNLQVSASGLKNSKQLCGYTQQPLLFPQELKVAHEIIGGERKKKSNYSWCRCRRIALWQQLFGCRAVHSSSGNWKWARRRTVWLFKQRCSDDKAKLAFEWIQGGLWQLDIETHSFGAEEKEGMAPD